MVLNNDECIKWLALFEVLMIINKYCERHGLDYEETINRKMKSNHIKEYIEGRFPILCNSFDSGRVGYESDFVREFVYGEI